MSLPRLSLAALALALPTFLVGGCGASTTTNVVGPTATKCQVSISNSASEVPSAGGSGTLTVSSERECSWSAHTDAGWIALGSTSGQGPATIDYSVQANPNGTARSGQVAVSDQTVSVVQAAAPCKYAVSPASADVDASPGEVAFTLTATSGCRWTAKSGAPWIGSASPSDGTGNATVRFSVAANAAEARVGTVTVGDAEASIHQSAAAAPVPPPTPPPAEPPPTPPPTSPPPPPPACSFTVAPLRASIGAVGGDLRFSVTAGSGCAWTASSGVSWISIKSGAAGSGGGTVVATVSANIGAARTGAFTIAGATVTIDQAALPAPTCTYQLVPSSRDVTADAQDLSVAMTTTTGCEWKVTSDVPWITVADGAAGMGAGTFRLTVAANTGDARTGTVKAGTEVFTVRQAAPVAACTYAIKPDYYNAGRGPDSVDVSVTAGPSCAWTASTNATWVSIGSFAGGTGDGSVRLLVSANDGAPRTAIVTIANLPFTLRQQGVCTFEIKPTYYDAGKGPDDIKIQVTTDPDCAWTASSPVPWATIAEGATGTGSGTVRVLVDANTGGDRDATLTIAGQPFKLTQKGQN